MSKISNYQKKLLHTNLYNFQVEHYANKDKEGYSRFFFKDNYQRGVVWELNQQISFIENIVKGTPFGTITVSKNNKRLDYEVIDGQQRITAFWAFIENKFPVFDNIFYKDFDEMEKGLFLRIPTPTLDVGNATEKEIAEFYIQINSTGIRHSFEDIKKAEDYLSNLSN